MSHLRELPLMSISRELMSPDSERSSMSYLQRLSHGCKRKAWGKESGRERGGVREGEGWGREGRREEKGVGRGRRKDNG